MVFVWVMTSRSKHFMTMGVSAIEWQTLRQVIDGFFGIGIMVAVLKHTVTTDCASKMLKMSVRTTAGWVKHPFSIRQGMRSVSVALTIYRVLFFTSAAVTESIWSSGGGSPGVLGSFGYMWPWLILPQQHSCSWLPSMLYVQFCYLPWMQHLMFWGGSEPLH